MILGIAIYILVSLALWSLFNFLQAKRCGVSFKEYCLEWSPWWSHVIMLLLPPTTLLAFDVFKDVD